MIAWRDVVGALTVLAAIVGGGVFWGAFVAVAPTWAIVGVAILVVVIAVAC